MDKLIKADDSPNHSVPELYPHPLLSAIQFGPRRHLRDYWHIVERRKWIVLAVVVTFVAASAVYTLRQTPIYQASAKLEIDLQSANVLPYQDFKGQSDAYYYYEEYLQTQIQHIQGRDLARRVALASGLEKEVPEQPESKGSGLSLKALLQWVQGDSESEENARPPTRDERIEQAAAQVQGGLSVIPVRNSRIVEIRYDSPDPEQAARIVNTMADEYIEYNFESGYDKTTKATEFLQKQLVDLKAKVETSEEALVDYARKHQILNVSDKQDVATETLSSLNAQLTQAQSARMSKESVYRTLSGATPENFPQALRTPLIEQLEGNLLADEQALANITAQFGSGMPQVKKLTNQVAEARRQLRKEKLSSIDNARTEYQTALERERLLAEAVDKQKALVNKLNESSIHYNILRREVETNKQLYDGLLQRMKEAGVAAGLKSSNIQIVERAEVPGAPYSPNLPKNLVLAFMLGSMGGLGLAFFMNYLDNTVKTPEDVEDLTGLPALGLIPSLQSARGHYGYLPAVRRHRRDAESTALVKQGVELATLTSGRSMIAEAYRGLRTALLLSTPENPPKTIVVTSPKAGEGKTTTVCNLALSLAQAGKRVLILDCDMRRPRIKRIFQENGHAGLSEYLTGQTDFSDVAQESMVPNLCVVNSGTTPPNPGELLGSKKMQHALEAAGEVFDFVLIDTPPLMSVTDPLMLAPMVDGVILVTEGSKNPPEVLNRAKRTLEQVHARILGVVVNNVDLQSSDYHYYYHQYYEYDSYVSEKEA